MGWEPFTANVAPLIYNQGLIEPAGSYLWEGFHAN